VGEIDEGRAGADLAPANLSSALRVFVLREVQARATRQPSEIASATDQTPGSQVASGSSG